MSQLEKNKFDYFFLQEHGFFNDSSKYGNVTVSGLKFNDKDGYVYVEFRLCLVVIKKDGGFLEDVIKMWKKFGNKSITEQEFTAGGECSFCCNGSFTYTIPDSFLVDTKSYLVWYERQRPGTGTSLSQTSNIVLREPWAERAWCQSSLFLTKWVLVLAPTHLLLQRSEHLFTLRQRVEETCLICDDPLSISVSILVPRASWGPEHEDQEALGTQDLKSKILELPVISESEVSWGILF